MGRFMDGIRHALSVFDGGEDTTYLTSDTYASSYMQSPSRTRLSIGGEKTIIGSVYTRIGIDVAAVTMQHVRLDKEKRYLETIDSGLNFCLTEEANLDQASRAFLQDVAMTLFEKGVIAIVCTHYVLSGGSIDIRALRVGHVVKWEPKKVVVSVWNEDEGKRQEIKVDKRQVAIVENPLYTVMNEPNSTLQRLIRKLALLDQVDEQLSSGKLDIIIQLPYVIKTTEKKLQADSRKRELEAQLSGSKYGIAYTDGSEKITQLNRPAENNMLAQIETLTAKLYSELGLTPAVFDGTADEAQMVNYHNRTVEPILAAITQGMKRSFLTRTARSQGQSIEAYRDAFKYLTIENVGDLADKLLRNEVVTANELRPALGLKPSKEKGADELRNKNLPDPEAAPPPAPPAPPDAPPDKEGKEDQNGRQSQA